MIEKNYNKILKLIRVELPEEEQGKYTHRNYLGGIVKLRFKKRKGRRYFSFKWWSRYCSNWELFWNIKKWIAITY